MEADYALLDTKELSLFSKKHKLYLIRYSNELSIDQLDGLEIDVSSATNKDYEAGDGKRIRLSHEESTESDRSFRPLLLRAEKEVGEGVCVGKAFTASLHFEPAVILPPLSTVPPEEVEDSYRKRPRLAGVRPTALPTGSLSTHLPQPQPQSQGQTQSQSQGHHKSSSSGSGSSKSKSKSINNSNDNSNDNGNGNSSNEKKKKKDKEDSSSGNNKKEKKDKKHKHNKD
eukprot:scaffold2817_cov177-Ochromonas_danica.AAC.1